jgi:hypothetical protein
MSTKVSRDDLGRWATATLTGFEGDSFTLISMYNVVDVALSATGPSTIFSQQYQLLRLAGVTYPNPQQQDVDDLNCHIAKLTANNESVVVMGDFNETLGTNPRMMAKVCADHDLFDVLFQKHGDDVQIPTCARGTKRLDYCLASAPLQPIILACGYNLFNEYFFSDHRAIFVDFRLKEFFGHSTPKLVNPDQRFASSSSPTIKKFIHKMYSHLVNNQVFHKYQVFCLDRDVLDKLWVMANNIDTLIGQAFLTAEAHWC